MKRKVLRVRALETVIDLENQPRQYGLVQAFLKGYRAALRDRSKCGEKDRKRKAHESNILQDMEP